jgi:hypothetical protein
VIGGESPASANITSDFPFTLNYIFCTIFGLRSEAQWYCIVELDLRNTKNKYAKAKVLDVDDEHSCRLAMKEALKIRRP